MPKKQTIDQLTDDLKAVETQATLLQQEILTKQKQLDKLNNEFDALLTKIRGLRNRPLTAGPVGKTSSKKKPGAKRKPGLSDAILEQCKIPKSRAQLVKILGNAYGSKSIDAALSKLKKQGCKSGSLAKLGNGQYQTGEPKGNPVKKNAVGKK